MKTLNHKIPKPKLGYYFVHGAQLTIDEGILTLYPEH